MPVQRKVFRIEENPRAFVRGRAPLASSEPVAPTEPSSDAYLAELKEMRALLEPRLSANRDALERARAQIAEAEAYRAELDTVYAAIEASRQTNAMLSGGAGHGEPPFVRAGRELDAIVAGTERAAQAILRAAEAIDTATDALRDGASPEPLARDIGNAVAKIYETCNFQDLTGQRVDNVLATLRAIEAQVGRLMQIWRGIEQFQPVVFDDPSTDDRRFLNGPKLAGDRGHSSQDEIDAMFGGAA